MEDIETIKDNVNENNSLMRKTKKELVEIILRKDNIEKGLRCDIKGTMAMLDEIRNKYEDIEKDHEILLNEYHNICDENVSIECELNNTIKFLRKLLIILIITIILILISRIIFLFIL